MILIVQHFKNRVKRLYLKKSDRWEILSNNYSGLTVLKCLVSLNQEFNLQRNNYARLAWIKKSRGELLESELTNIEQVVLKPLELKFFCDSEKLKTNIPLGISYFGSPALLNYPKEVAYSTWHVSEQVGLVWTKLIDWNSIIKQQTLSFNAFLLILGFDLYTSGATVISEPQLSGLGDSQIDKNHIKRRDYVFLAHRGTKRQQLFYFFKFPGIGLINYLRKRHIKISNDDLIKSIYNDLAQENTIPDNSYDVIIPTIGRAKYLHQVLEDLNAQLLPPKNVIIVEQVLGAPFESELDFLKKNYNFHVIHHLTNKPGACNARNIALSQVKSEWVFFADDDIRISEDVCLEVIKRCLTYKFNAISLAVFQPHEEINVSNILTTWDSFGTCSSFVKRELIGESKFDEALEFGFGEDTDFGIALRRKGAKIYYGAFRPLLHLKAPIGGFRYKHNFPWDNQSVIPRPSPTVQYSILKNLSINQQKGYKWYYLGNRLLKTPLNIVNIFKEWNSSIEWAMKLLHE